MASDHYYLWVKSNCSYCVKAQNNLLERLKPHTIYVMDKKPEEIIEQKEKWNWDTVPIIVYENERNEQQLIGGCTDLIKWFENKEEQK